MAKGRIHISPFSSACLNPNSYNFRLHPQLLVIQSGEIDPREEENYRIIELKADGFLLEPGQLYLGSTLEVIGSADYVITLMGRSSLGRLGLFLQITADLGQLGCEQCWTLELKVVQPLIVYPKMTIGQVCFWTVEGPIDSYYQGKYDRDDAPRCSQMHQEFA